MRKILIVLFLCSNVFAYENLVPTQKLSTTLTYSCDDPVLEDSFVKMFAIWNFACDNIFTLTKVPDSSIIIKLNPNLITHKAGETWPLGEKAFIFIKDSNDNLNMVMLHEIGHALGLDHSKVLNSIMQANIKREATLIQDDVDGIREHYDLSPKIFDFALKIKGKGVNCVSSYGKVDWWTDDLRAFKNKSKFRCNFHRTGTYSIEMSYNGISVYKEVIIK